MDKLNTTAYLRSSTRQGSTSSLSNDIILSLLYFDIFQYPLTAREIFHHSTVSPLSENLLATTLEELLQKKEIQTEKGFFFLPSREKIVDRRISGNQKALEYIGKAQKISRFISFFPFVRGIFLSGSVSKGYADKDSDIDYFIVTEPGRLWLSRTLLILFKKLFLLNSRKYFCLNYFIDHDHLEIQDKNLFTAIELSYLLPVYNETIHKAIVRHNDWTKNYLPNFTADSFSILPVKKRFLKNSLEKLFSGFTGNKLDDFCLLLTEKFWKYKYRKTPGPDLSGIRCKKYVSKFHPQNFQSRILDEYERKINAYGTLHAIDLRS